MPHTNTGTTLEVEQRPDELVLGHYEDQTIIAMPDASGGTLVIDQDDGARDARLVGRIDPDEPDENAQVLAGLYVDDPTRGRCRSVTETDFEGTIDEEASVERNARWDVPLVAGMGETLQLQVVPVDASIPAVRWTRTNGTSSEVVSLRDVVGRLENYEPALTFTEAAVRHHEQTDVSTILLRGELKRMHASSIVLNRRLREHLQQAVSAGELSMSEIAIRCRRVKHDKHGRVSGDTSWLARRIGQLPEAGKTRPTAWVHSDVLALIARDGLGVAPREVEVA